MRCKKLRQFKIHRGVRDIENVGCDRDVAQRGSTQLCESFDQRWGWIERRARKRAEAGDEDAE